MEYDFYEPKPALSSKMKYKTRNDRFRTMFTDRHNPKDGNFRCLHCRSYVVQTPALSGVKNRNHCPYCLWSKHIDLHQSGDRLAACKRQMRPVGLAMKKSRKKYGDTARGELMLIHQCEECGKLSINRIAADDIAERIYEILDGASGLSVDTHHQLKQNGIQPLELEDAAVVKNRLFGIKGIRK
jgi:hypothetical protein